MTPLPDDAGDNRLDAPTEWTSTVVEHHRLRHDLAVIRLVGEFVPFEAGQSVEVRIPQHPGMKRRLSPALPPSLDGKLEFHVRTVPGGWCSQTIVNETAPGDQWRIGMPAGWMAVHPGTTDLVMIAGGTGLAPMRSLLLDVSRRPEPPRTHLFIGGRFPRDLYASDMLFLMAGELPWLTVIPVVQSATDPGWPDQWYERTATDVGFDVDEMLEGTLAEVVGDMGPLEHHQVLVCGSPGMTQATVEALLNNGTPAEAISFDGF
ncbi:MAG: oxidoreductase [Nocardia sp.]|nr:oxidoreductase [Nocardia sp.]